MASAPNGKPSLFLLRFRIDYGILFVLLFGPPENRCWFWVTGTTTWWVRMALRAIRTWQWERWCCSSVFELIFLAISLLQGWLALTSLLDVSQELSLICDGDRCATDASVLRACTGGCSAALAGSGGGSAARSFFSTHVLDLIQVLHICGVVHQVRCWSGKQAVQFWMVLKKTGLCLWNTTTTRCLSHLKTSSLRGFKQIFWRRRKRKKKRSLKVHCVVALAR